MPDNIGPFRMPFYKCRNYQDCYLTTFNFDPSVGPSTYLYPGRGPLLTSIVIFIKKSKRRITRKLKTTAVR